MGAAKEKIVTILEFHEDSLSDGFGYYADDVQAELLTIADEIIAALDTKEQNGSSHNSESKPCCKATFALVLEYTLGKVEKCPVCGTPV